MTHLIHSNDRALAIHPVLGEAQGLTEGLSRPLWIENGVLASFRPSLPLIIAFPSHGDIVRFSVLSQRNCYLVLPNTPRRQGDDGNSRRIEKEMRYMNDVSQDIARACRFGAVGSSALVRELYRKQDEYCAISQLLMLDFIKEVCSWDGDIPIHAGFFLGMR